MGQEQIYLFLKTNQGKSFSAKEIADQTQNSIRIVYARLEALEKDKEIDIKQSSVGNGNHITKLYSYVERSEIDEIQDEVLKLRQRFFISSEAITSMLLVKEIRKLREAIETWQK